ncbi:MAG TPA: Pr6Pr family membrane protein [Rhizomicrobium sp.]|nr:Pr6Pr family membrane protein [Rhizomicrobium sp.]
MIGNRWAPTLYDILPLSYCAYAFVRGAIDRWYAYAFLDGAKIGAAQAALNCAGLVAAFALMAILLAGLDRVLR